MRAPAPPAAAGPLKATTRLTNLRFVALRQRDDEIVSSGRLRRGDHLFDIHLLIKAADVFCHRAREQLDVLRQIADVTSELIRRPLIECAPSKRTLPLAGCQTPTNRRASEDLPEALGPITPSPSPVASSKPIIISTTRRSPGGTADTFSTRQLVTRRREARTAPAQPARFREACTVSSTSVARPRNASSSPRRFRPAPSVRETKIELAMITPAVAS